VKEFLFLDAIHAKVIKQANKKEETIMQKIPVQQVY
jgi:hypothetical protein